MSNFRNASKYKHTVANIQKKELWYPDIKPSPSSADFNSIAASGRWVAMSWLSAGTIGILGLEEVGKRKTMEVPLISAHSNGVSDLMFDPFNDNILATSGEDCAVKLWKIDAPEGSDSTAIKSTNSLVTLTGHKKRVDCIQFHPNARGILASGSSDKTVKVWDLESGKESYSLDGKHDDIVNSIAWNWNGNLLATISKDKKIRIFDVRSNQTAIQTGEAHQGVKPNRLIWLGDSNRLFSTGFSKTRERQIGLWDGNDLSKPLLLTNFDNSTGVLDPIYDADTGLLFLCGKGDGGIKVLEVEAGATKAPFYKELATVQSDVPQKSTAFIPKRACDLMGTEVFRLLKLGANAIVPVSFSVPRKSKTEFQEDLYPPTRSEEPAQTGKEWLSGETKPPKLTQLKAERNPNKFWFDDNDYKSQTSSSTSSSSSSSSSSSTSSSNNNNSNIPSTVVTSTKEEIKKEESSSSASSSPSTSKRGSAILSSSNNDNSNSPSTSRGRSGSTSVQVVRSSKFRHIVGKGTKQETCYNNIKASPAGNNSAIRANTTYFSVPLQGAGGRIGIVPLSKTGRQPDSLPYLECGSECLDFDFNPFHDNIFATVTESAHLQIWNIPNGNLSVMRTPEKVLKGHTRRVTSVDFHPVVDNIAITGSGDFTIRLWDIEKGEESIKLEGPTDMVQSISWNWEGSQFACSAKDKELRVYDPRNNNVVHRFEAHDGIKGFKVNWLGQKDQFFTVGFSKSSGRQIALWDLKNTSKPLSLKEIDNGAGIMTPYYDPDTGVIFCSGKGDGNIKMFEIDNNELHHLTDYTSSTPTLGLTLLPKWSNNVKDCEIAQFLKLHVDYVEPLHFTVPRTRMELFQDDLFPPTRKTNEPSLSASEWLNGQTKPLSLVDLKPEGMLTLSDNPVERKEKKYDFNEERNKKDSEFSRDKFLDRYHQQMQTAKESENQVLKQDLMEGTADEEWD